MKACFALLFASSVFLLCQGCSGGNDSTVIMPGEDYQLNEQEEANLKAEMEMRKGG